jgi:hypothetical protein
VGSNPTGGMDVLSVESVVFCQVEVSVTSLSLVQRSPTAVVRRCVCCRNLVNEEAITSVGSRLHRGKNGSINDWIVPELWWSTKASN